MQKAFVVSMLLCVCPVLYGAAPKNVTSILSPRATACQLTKSQITIQDAELKDVTECVDLACQLEYAISAELFSFLIAIYEALFSNIW